MKIPPARVEAFLGKPDAAVRAVLLFGPDAGLVRERADRLARGVVPDESDPFRISDFAGSDLAADPPRLNDEAAAMCMTGGRRVVRVRNADDKLGETFAEFLADPVGDALIVVEAGELAGRSKLRAAFEGAKSGAVIACYVEEGDALLKSVSAAFKDRGLKPYAEAVRALATILGPDRMLLRSEVEKLALYVGEKAPVCEADVLACAAEAAETSLDEAIDAAMAGLRQEVDQALRRMAAEGAAPVSALRGLARHLLALEKAQARTGAGEDLESVMPSLRIFFKRAPAFRAQMRAWRGRRLADALSRVTQGELRCKETGQPDRMICERVFLDLAAMARASARAA